MKRIIPFILLALVAIGATAQQAMANDKNSIQPAHVYLGTVHLGERVGKVMTYRNGTGRAETIYKFGLTGSGGNVFTFGLGQSTCKVGLTVAAGDTCTLQVHTNSTHKTGWFRSSASIWVRDGAGVRTYNSAEIRAHIVP